MRNARKKKENLGEREPLVFLLISLVSRTVTKVALLFIRNLHLNTHTNYVCKTYGRDSRSQEIGTSRESRDRCHLLRARIRHADVDQFVYQRQRLIFKGIKIFLSSLLVLLLGAFLSLSLLLSFFFVFKLSVMVSIISMLLRFVFTHRVYYYGSRLPLEFGSKRAFVADSFCVCVKNGRDDGNEPSSRPLCQVVFIRKKY